MTETVFFHLVFFDQFFLYSDHLGLIMPQNLYIGQFLAFPQATACICVYNRV